MKSISSNIGERSRGRKKAVAAERILKMEKKEAVAAENAVPQRRKWRQIKGDSTEEVVDREAAENRWQHRRWHQGRRKRQWLWRKKQERKKEAAKAEKEEVNRK